MKLTNKPNRGYKNASIAMYMPPRVADQTSHPNAINAAILSLLGYLHHLAGPLVAPS